MKFTLYGPLPSKKNSRITLPSGKTIPSHDYGRWCHDARWIVRDVWRKPPTDKPVSVRVRTSCRGDLDNIYGSVLDMLEGLVYENDRQVRRIEGEKVPKNRQPYFTEVEVEEL